jgi:hypothetical protein
MVRLQAQDIIYREKSRVTEEFVDLGGKDKGLAQDVTRQAIYYHLSIAQEHNAVGTLSHQLHVVGGHHYGPPFCLLLL